MSRIRHASLIFPGPNGRVPATLVRPAGAGPWAAVLLVHEAIGVTRQLLGVADRLAAEGYITLVPDLYGRDLARQELSDDEVPLAHTPTRAADRETARGSRPTQREAARRILAWSAARDRSTNLPDLSAALAGFRDQPGVRVDAIAAIGFSLGGGLVTRLAARGDGLAAGVSFYGVPPEPGLAARVRIPLQLHFAETDAMISAAAPAFFTALERSGSEFTRYIYPGTRHGFFNETRPTYDALAATLAWRRAIGFLRRTLADRRGEAVRA